MIIATPWRERFLSALPVVAGAAALAIALCAPNDTELAMVTVPIILVCAIAIGHRHPVGALNGLVLVFMTAHPRLGVARFGVASAGGVRGWVYLADILLLGVALGTLFKRSSKPRGQWHIPAGALLMLPYVALSIVLPILGVIWYGVSPSYALPAFRWLQWIVLAYLAYHVTNLHGLAVVHAMKRMLLAVVFLHGLYALLQLGCYKLTVVPEAFLMWDGEYVAQNLAGKMGSSWFGVRATGLQVNPNSYGLVAAFVVIAIVAYAMSRAKGSMLVLFLGAAAGALGMLLSGSRTAAVALILVCASGAVVPLLRPGVLVRWSAMVAGFVLLCGIAASTVDIPFESAYVSRFGATLSSFDSIRTEASMLERQQVWTELLSSSEQDYPLGTWAPPAYVYPYTVDSMYVQTLVQGTALYTVTLIAFIVGAIAVGWRCFTANETGTAAWAGLVLAGWALAVAASSFTMGVLNDAEICAPFVAMFGCAAALTNRAAFLPRQVFMVFRVPGPDLVNGSMPDRRSGSRQRAPVVRERRR
ncbi:MAG: hypothetical protein ABSF98_00770 [Bryobacteraceae bacterium]|jgi:hypothetical protein